VSNQEGNVVYQNKQSTQLFGKQFCHLIDLAHHTSGKWFKMDGKSPINAFELPFGGFAADLDENIEYEYLFQLDSDQNIPLQIKVNRNGAFEAKDVLYVWNFSDISESYYTSMKLEETNKHLDNFVRATAHDLKSPVTNIMNLFNLMDKFEDQDKKDMVLSKIKASAEKLDDLLGGLMEMVDAQGNKQINIEELNFNEVMEFVISECNLDGLADKVRIVSNFHVEKIVYNKAYLRSIFLNLINNAIKYRDESRLCEITISTQLHGDEVVLKVADTGSGIDLDKHQDNLFKPFKRLTAKGSGKGIGLNLIKNFVEKNGGHVFVESKVGEGTTFACVLVPYPNNDLQTSMF
ncbi:MAG: sensor histidine kinase, partial [Flavobacteriales bacterium]